MQSGQIVRTARERRGLTIAELAKKTGLHFTTLYSIEKGETSPRMDTMLRIMRALDYDIVFNPRYKGGYDNER